MPSPHGYSGSVPADSHYVGALVTYIVGMVTFLPYIVSLIITFAMVHKGYVHGTRKAIVLTMTIIELIAWLFCASFSWFYTKDCYYCSEMYWGWIAIVIWFSVGLSCGIPRLVFLKMQEPASYQLHH